MNELIKFFKKFKIQFPTFFENTEAIEFTPFIIEEIKKIINLNGEVNDTASPVLKQIRKDTQHIPKRLQHIPKRPQSYPR